jgi:cytochrome c oxidase assembly protein subunit 15
LRRFALGNCLLVGTTVLSGAFVAGNDAGRAFNTFPKMGDEWVPSEVFDLRPLWRNLFENTATVQFDHRMLAYTSFTSLGIMYSAALRSGHWYALPANTRMLFHAVAGMACTQVGLGLATLLLYVPVSLGVAHQAGSLTLLTLVACLAHSLNFSRYGRIVIPAAAAMRAAAIKV